MWFSFGYLFISLHRFDSLVPPSQRFIALAYVLGVHIKSMLSLRIPFIVCDMCSNYISCQKFIILLSIQEIHFKRGKTVIYHIQHEHLVLRERFFAPSLCNHLLLLFCHALLFTCSCVEEVSFMMSAFVA